MDRVVFVAVLREVGQRIPAHEGEGVARLLLDVHAEHVKACLVVAHARAALAAE